MSEVGPQRIADAVPTPRKPSVGVERQKRELGVCVTHMISWRVASVGMKILMYPFCFEREVWAFPMYLRIFQCVLKCWSLDVRSLDHLAGPLIWTQYLGIFSRPHKNVRVSRLGDLFRYPIPHPPPLFLFWLNHANIAIQKYFVTFLGNVSQEEIATQPQS